jgi:hypothetical protein
MSSYPKIVSETRKPGTQAAAGGSDEIDALFDGGQARASARVLFLLLPCLEFIAIFLFLPRSPQPTKRSKSDTAAADASLAAVHAAVRGDSEDTPAKKKKSKKSKEQDGDAPAPEPAAAPAAPLEEAPVKKEKRKKLKKAAEEAAAKAAQAAVAVQAVEPGKAKKKKFMMS